MPADFRFAVKVPRAITHDQRLVACDVLLQVFLEEASALGDRMGPLLVQMPPSLAFDAAIATDFFHCLRELHQGDVVCEPRHATWFAAEADALLVTARVARAGADPACVEGAERPGGWRGLPYLRLHGSPRMYYSSYERERLEGYGALLRSLVSPNGPDRDDARVPWCVFDNTTLGAATGNALELQRIVG